MMKTMKMKFMRFAACTAFAAMAASAFAAGSPALERAEVRLPGGKALRIEAPESATKRYVASVSLNGKTVKWGTGLAGALLLILHQCGEGFLVDAQTCFLCNFTRQVDGEAESIVELEDFLA